MKLRDIVEDSLFATIGTITDREGLDDAEQIWLHNRLVTELFTPHILQCNAADYEDKPFINKHCSYFLQHSIFNTSVDMLPENRGHMWGTIDLDEACLQQAKLAQVKYLWKGTSDFLVGPAILDVEVPEDFDFAYLPGFSLQTLEQASDRTEDYEQFKFVPQTNFFIIRVDAVDSLYGNAIEEKKAQYEEVKKLHPHIKPWDMQFSDGIKFACEDHLARTTANLKNHCLLSPITLNNLIDFVRVNKVADPSHKNIYFTQTQLCHYHNARAGVYNID